MTKRRALSILGSLGFSALLADASVSHILWHRGYKRLAAALLGGGAAADGLFVYSFLVPNFPLLGKTFYRGSGADSSVALTFDDGPRSPYTEQILEVLEREGVTATFFILGENARRSPELVRRIEAGGHRVANHGNDHDILMWAGAEAALRQLEEGERALKQAGITAPAPLFRAPHGWLSPKAHRAITGRGYRVAGWTKGVWDTALPGTEVIVARTAELLNSGSILLLHDGWQGPQPEDRSQTVAALPGIIREARSRGLKFVTLEELIREAEAGAGRR